MKRKRPLITKHDMRKLVAQARKTLDTLKEPVQVQPLLRFFYPERPISGQMRRLVAAALDRAGIDRAKRQDPVMPKSLTSRKAMEREPVIEVQEYPVPKLPDGLAGDAVDVARVLDRKIREEFQRLTGKPNQAAPGKPFEVNGVMPSNEAATDELDDFLADEASKGNRRALRLLKIQIGRG